MPINIRRLTQDETSKFFPRGIGVPQVEYIDALRGLRPGDVAEAVRGNVSGRAFKRRLTLAAKHLGLALHYAKEAGEEAVRFQVRQPRTQPPLALPEGTPKRRGRPPKAARTA